MKAASLAAAAIIIAIPAAVAADLTTRSETPVKAPPLYTPAAVQLDRVLYRRKRRRRIRPLQVRLPRLSR
jgi:hypothetical protein